VCTSYRTLILLTCIVFSVDTFIVIEVDLIRLLLLLLICDLVLLLFVVRKLIQVIFVLILPLVVLLCLIVMLFGVNSPILAFIHFLCQFKLQKLINF